MRVDFENGFHAEFVPNPVSTTAHLYSPEYLFLASVPCDEQHFQPVAEALLQGYFAGWRTAKRSITSAVTAACEIPMPE